MLGAYVFDENYIVLNRTERLLLYLGDGFMKKLFLIFLAYNVEIWNAFDDVAFDSSPLDESRVFYDGIMNGQAIATKLIKATKGNKIAKILMTILLVILGSIALNLILPLYVLYILGMSISDARNPDFDINNLYDPDYMDRPLFR